MEHIKAKFERYQRDNKNNSQSKTDNTMTKRRKDEQTHNDQRITTKKTKYRVTRISLSTAMKSDFGKCKFISASIHV